MAHHSLDVFEFDTTSYDQRVLDGNGDFSADEYRLPSLRAAESIIGIYDGPIDTILLRDNRKGDFGGQRTKDIYRHVNKGGVR